MHKSASIAVVVALVLGGVAACGDGDNGAPAPTLTGVEGVSPPPASPSPTPTSSTPKLAVGQTISITTATSEVLDVPGGTADVTLVALDVTKTFREPDNPSSVTQADPGEQIVVWTFKVKNTGTEEFDTYPLSTAARWTSNGQVAGPDGAIPDDSFVNQPEPRAGETVTGTDAASVPDQNGTLEFQDRNSNPLFAIVVSR